jgi:hypothetical protein
MKSVTVTNIQYGPVEVSVNGVIRGNADSGRLGEVEVPITGCLKVGDILTVQDNFNNGRFQVIVESHEKYNVLTQHYNNERTGWYQYENQLTPQLLKQCAPNDFRQQFQLPVDGITYAQPLYMHPVNFGAGKFFGTARNVVFLATENNSVYAYDADDPNVTLLWKRSMLKQGEHTPTSGEGDLKKNIYWSNDIHPTVGISSTPVISCPCQVPGQNFPALYVTSKTIDSSGTFHWYLHALNVTTGQDIQVPVEIKSGPGIAEQTPIKGKAGDSFGSDDKYKQEKIPNPHFQTNDGYGNLIFSPALQNNRPALLLQNGIIYIAFASHGDFGWYFGWIFGYDALTLKQKYAFCTTPDALARKPTDSIFIAPAVDAGGIWMGGFGLASDGQFIYCTTANGANDAIMDGSAVKNFGNSVLKLSLDLKQVVSSFTPAARHILDNGDIDLGSGGAMLIPGNLLITCGKDGNVTLLDRTNLGGYKGTDKQHFDSKMPYTLAEYPDANPNAVQTILLQPTKPIDFINTSSLSETDPTNWSYSLNQWGVFGGPAFFDGGANNQFIFYCGSLGKLTAFKLQNRQLAIQGITALTFGGLGGATPVVSSNGQTNAIAWAVNRNYEDSTNEAYLCAYDPNGFSNIVKLGEINKPLLIGPSIYNLFVEPTIINGKVYVACKDHIGVFFCANETKVL